MSDVNTQGKKFKPSLRFSGDVKVGDWVKILGNGSEGWCKEAREMVDNVYRVKEVSIYTRIYLEHDECFGFRTDEFVIMEEDTAQVKISRNHPHAEMIRQWLDDASLEVEYRPNSSEPWSRSGNPMWEPTWRYRFKPKTVPAWKVLFKYCDEVVLSSDYYQTEEDFYKVLDNGEKFIKFVLETEKQIPA